MYKYRPARSQPRDVLEGPGGIYMFVWDHINTSNTGSGCPDLLSRVLCMLILELEVTDTVKGGVDKTTQRVAWVLRVGDMEEVRIGEAQEANEPPLALEEHKVRVNVAVLGYGTHLFPT